MDFKFKRRRLNEIPVEKILGELEKAAHRLNYIEFGYREFNSIAGISAGVVKKRFNGWKKGLEALRKHLEAKGLNLLPRPHAPNQIYSDKQLFDEMERIWNERGQRPSKNEWEISKPKIAYPTYKKRFGGWTNACLKFIEYKMGSVITVDEEPNDFSKVQPCKTDGTEISKTENNRSVPLSLRLRVLDRDNFRCCYCGRSPATEAGVRLHIDHIVPFSKNGKTTLENLQTLCFECNLGKGNKELRE